MIGYTKGPWLSSYENTGEIAWHVEVKSESLAGNDEYPIADLWGPDAEFNARLIAAAPDLLEALKEAREALHQHYVDWDGEPEDAAQLQLARAKCEAAIAKATDTAA